MSGARLRRRLDRGEGTVRLRAIVQLVDPDYLEAAGRWAGVSPIEVVTEAWRIDAQCRMAGASTAEARLEVVAADGAVSVEELRAELADLQRTLLDTVAS